MPQNPSFQGQRLDGLSPFAGKSAGARPVVPEQIGAYGMPAIQVISGLPNAAYIADKAGLLISWNQQFVDMFAMNPAPGTDVWLQFSSVTDTSGLPLNTDQQPLSVCLLQSRAADVELIITTTQKRRLYIHSYCQPLHDQNGLVIGALDVLVDQTRMKEVELALQESEARFKELSSSLETMVAERVSQQFQKSEGLQSSEQRYQRMVEEVEDYAILLLDTEGFIQNWNAGAGKIKGYEESEIIGKNFRIFYLPEDQQSRLPETLIAQAVTTGKAMHEGWRVRKDGTRFWGSIVITALHDDDGRVVGFSKVTRDLSDKKAAEDKIRNYARELEIQNKELEQFAYVASHDLKEPLRKIQFYSSYVADRNADKLDEKGKEYLNRAIHAAARMHRLIEDILEYSQAESNSELFQLVDLKAVADEVAASAMEGEDADNVQISVGPLPSITGIPFQLRQLFENLMGNAIKYRKPGVPAVISIASRRVQGKDTVCSQAVAEQWYHEVSLSDNGIGFDPKYGEKIFDLFQRLHKKTELSGSGIGLATCKKIMQHHQGFIKATGNVNAGARFDLFFPLSGGS